MKKIYIYAIPTGTFSYGVIRDAEPTGDVVGYAICEDGRYLDSHVSSGVTWSKHDMGLTSDWKHEIYAEACPEGYELEWIDYENLDSHEGLQDAYALNLMINSRGMEEIENINFSEKCNI